MSKFTKAFKNSENYQFLQTLIRTPDENLVDFLEANKEELGYKEGQKLPHEKTLKKAKSYARARVCEKLNESVKKQTEALEKLTSGEDTQLNEETTNSQLKQRQEQLAKHDKELQRLLKIYEAFEIERSEEINRLVEEANKQVESYGNQAEELDKKFKTQHSKIDDLNFIALHTNNPLGFEFKKIKASDNVFAHAQGTEAEKQISCETLQKKPDAVDRAPEYKGVEIKKDEAIVAKKTFDDGSQGILKQFSNGKVTHFSNGPMTSQNKNEIAIQQVSMLLANFDPAKGKIILRGHDTEMVKKVYAGLLLAAKEGNLKVKDKNTGDLVEITGYKDIDKLVDVRVSDVKPSMFTSYDSYVKTQLGDGGFLGFNKKIKNEERKANSLEGANRVGSDYRERLQTMKAEAKEKLDESSDEKLREKAEEQVKMAPK